MFYRRLRRARKDERGTAVLTVVLVSTMVFAACMSFASSSMLNVTLTADSRDSIKAMAAAEAGRDTILTDLIGGTCRPSGSVSKSSTTPAYSYKIHNYVASNNEIPRRPTHPGVASGCPSPASTHIIIETKGIAGDAAKTIYSTYRWNAGSASTVVSTPKGALVTGSRLVMSNFRILRSSGSTSSADVILSNGNFKCEGSGIYVEGSVYVQNGNVEDMQGCDGLLNLSASGSVWVNKWSGVAVSGNLCARGAIFNLWVLSTIRGLIQQFQSSCPGIGSGATGWTDFSPDLTNAVKITDQNICENNNNLGQPNVWRAEGHLAYRLKQFTQPTVVDLTDCPYGVRMMNVGGPNLQIRTDITLVMKRGDLQNFNVTSADGQPHLFNIVSPDGVTNLVNGIPRPDCISGFGELKVMQLKALAPISGLIYSPCTTSQVVVDWRGQIFMGNIQSNIANGTLTHMEITTEGWGTTSTSTSTTTAYPSLTLLSQEEA